MIKNLTLTLKNNFVKDFSIFTLHQTSPSALIMLVPLLELLLHLLPSLIEVILLLITQFILLFAMACPLILSTILEQIQSFLNKKGY
jgi:hypothetical protein